MSNIVIFKYIFLLSTIRFCFFGRDIYNPCPQTTFWNRSLFPFSLILRKKFVILSFNINFCASSISKQRLEIKAAITDRISLRSYLWIECVVSVRRKTIPRKRRWWCHRSTSLYFVHPPEIIACLDPTNSHRSLHVFEELMIISHLASSNQKLLVILCILVCSKPTSIAKRWFYMFVLKHIRTYFAVFMILNSLLP